MSDEQNITVAGGGPYLVKGSVPITSKSPIMSEHGEPLTWKTAPAGETKKRVALCRCGASENKPYCDGAHAAVDWDDTDNAPAGTYKERAQSHGGEGMEVFDDRPICVHAGFCGNQVTNVWKMAAKTGDSQVRAQAMAMIERCPSGALTYSVDGEMIEPDLPAEIAVIPDGPLWVGSGIEITRADGTTMEPRNRVTLCRCGQSGSKPLCDGSHKEAGFTG
ncbi:MAG: CDGSH iron-sulfur domain-containing protein [Acidimicrobiales bacterium]